MNVRLVLAAVLGFALAGCARFSVIQTDESPERTITTRISGVAWFASAQSISKLKATQTDKTQSFGTEAVGQHGVTNTVEMLNALANVLSMLRPSP